MENPLVTVIIPVKNASATIQKCVDSVLQSDYKNFELIVVDDGSTDRTPELLARYTGITVLRAENRGPSAARNLALSRAQGAFVAFTDADCIVDCVWLGELLKGFNDDKVAGVGGIQKSPKDETVFGRRVQEFFQSVELVTGYMQLGSRMRQTSHNPTCNVMYRRSAVAAANGFDESLWPGEDVELDLRIKRKGYNLVFTPAAVVYHYRCQDLGGFLRMMFRYGLSIGILTRRYGIFRLIQFLPLGIACWVFLCWFYVRAGLMFCLVLAAGMFVRGMMVSRYPWHILMLVCIALLCWNTGFIAGLFKKR